MTTAVDPAAAPTLLARPRRRPGWLLAVLLTGQFMAILDVSIVNVAAPTIRVDLATSGAGLQLVIAGYTIAYAVLLITGARIGARLGHRRTFLLGMAGFTLASLACGLAVTSAALIAFRFAQGAGAALMVPQILSLIQHTFDGAARARALSIYAASIASGAVVGQILGGVLVSADIAGTGWRPVFLVNVPIGVFVLVLGRRLMPADGGDPQRALDLPGLAALWPAVLLFIVPLVLGHEQGWPLWVWLSLGGSVVAGAAFALVERRVGRRGGAPLIPGNILRIPGLLRAVAVIFGTFTIYGGWLFSLALYYQSGLGHSALRTGLVFTPGAIGFATASLLWRRTPERWHRALVPVGLSGALVAFVGLALLASAGGMAGPQPVGFGAVLMVTGLGMGTAFSPVMTLALSQVRPADAPNVSGLLTTTLQLAQAVGVATLGSLYLSTVVGSGAPRAIAVTAVTLAVVELVTIGFAISLARRPAPAEERVPAAR